MAPQLPNAPNSSEALLFSVLASSLDGIMAFRAVRDAAGTIVDFEWLLANPRAEEIVGRPASALVGRLLLEEMPGNREAGLFDLYVRVVDTATPAHHIFFYDAEDTRAWFQATAVPLGDGFAVTFRDITRQKEAEEARMALGRAQLAIFDIDLEHGLLSRSESLDQIFGFPADGRQRSLPEVWAHVHPEDLEPAQRSYADMLSAQQEAYIELRALRPDGSLRWVGMRGRPLRNKDGRPTHVHVVLFDITDRKQAEEARARTETIFRRALAEAPFPLFIHADDGDIVDISAAVTDLTGYTHADIPTIVEWTEKAYGEQRHRIRAEIEQLFTIDARLSTGEYSIRTKQGDLRTWEFSSVPLGTDQRGRRLVLSMAADVTHRKRGESAERHARQAAEEALELRDQFLNTASHELKTPITALLGHTQLLARRMAQAGNLSERDSRTMEHIVQQSHRLSRLVAAMLDVARLQTRKLTLNMTPCVLQAVVERALSDLETALDGRPVELDLAVEPLYVSGDAQRLSQVVYNLLLNAASYSPPDALIRVELQREEDMVQLSVIDHGIGIPSSALPHIFGRFYRAPNVDPNRGVSGMGVGLYLASEIVTRHGGELAVTSEEGAGSIFTVRLPLLEAAEQAAGGRS